ncbi:sulfotransferase 1C2-like [Ornithodoros turicata]|uniref:sulfotransferase 1C2-like n=1 Tax=Ornithodoros turicata TaxID=34597 RepID=UPI0031399C50
MSRHRYHNVDGLFLGKHFHEQSVREAFNYKPCPDDVFITTYPKCGTTWTQHIVYHIFSNGVPPESEDELIAKTPFLEFMGNAAFENLPRPAAVKNHLPFHKMPYSKHVKYIYTARNPFDCCVAYYHHVKLFPMYDFEHGTFEELFQYFLDGKVDFGDYFDHLLSWYPHRNDPNVLFLTYEGLKKDIRAAIQKVADFLGEDYGAQLRKDPGLRERIVEVTSFENMQRIMNPLMRGLADKYTSIPVESLPGWAQRSLETCGDVILKPVFGDFVRKGIIGDWKNHFNADQVKRMNDWIKKRTAGSDVMDLWKDVHGSWMNGA